ncbi:hypothetical protein SGCOL_000330 [Colletotrichum sp. CLE4]
MPSYYEQGLKIGVNKAKRQVEEASIAAGIPTMLVLLGNFAEFALNTPGMDVDLPGNRIVYSGNSAEEIVDLRAISISELKATGNDFATAPKQKHGTPPQASVLSLDKVNTEVEEGLRSGSLFTLA